MGKTKKRYDSSNSSSSSSSSSSRTISVKKEKPVQKNEIKNDNMTKRKTGRNDDYSRSRSRKTKRNNERKRKESSSEEKTNKKDKNQKSIKEKEKDKEKIKEKDDSYDLKQNKASNIIEKKSPREKGEIREIEIKERVKKVIKKNPKKEEPKEEEKKQESNSKEVLVDTIEKNTQPIINSKEANVVPSNIIRQDPSTLTSRAGGIYIPPFKLAMMYEEIRQKNDKNSIEYQKMMFEMLRKSLNGIINKVNTSNIQNVIYELFNENLIRGQGLLARAIIKAQMASPNFTHVYACLVAVINTKLPGIARLIIDRYIIQFQKAYKRNNKIVCMAATKMLAHLVNQQVVHELLALEILAIFLENPTEDSIEMACDFMIECGQMLSEIYPPGVHSVFERFRGILHEGEIDKRVQYTIENLFAIRKTGFKDHPGIITELDLVSDTEKNPHEVSLDDKLDGKDILDIFSYDKEYEKNEDEWIEIKGEIIGVNQEMINQPINQEAEEAQEAAEDQNEVNKNDKILDFTETDLINLRRTIYLTIISSIDYQECCHKLLKLNMREGQEMELVNMIIECCNQERTYLRFYGLLAEQFCKIKETYKINFEIQFELQYLKIHRLETNKLRNLAKLFSHLLYTDAIEWYVFKSVKLTEEDTTSSSRIFIKIICQELAEYLGLEKLNKKFQEETNQIYFQGLFNKDHPKNTRFSINFFTSIGLGALTEKLREFLANAQKMLAENPNLIEDDSESSSSGSSSDSSSDNESESS